MENSNIDLRNTFDKESREKPEVIYVDEVVIDFKDSIACPCCRSKIQVDGKLCKDNTKRNQVLLSFSEKK